MVGGGGQGIGGSAGAAGSAGVGAALFPELVASDVVLTNSAGIHAPPMAETVLGITRERLRLPPNICGWLDGRSRFARVGLMIHVTAGFLSPGIDNRQVLEISSLADRPLRLHAGVSICQVVLQRAEGAAVYRGRFADQLAL